MNTRPESGWQHCGDGFSSVDKFNSVLSRIKPRTPVKNHPTRDDDEEIVSNTTPDAKPKGLSHSKDMPSLSSAAWNQGEFLHEFHVSQGVTSQTEDISWSSSSSDEYSTIESNLGVRKRLLKDCSYQRMKKRFLRSINFPHQPQTVLAGAVTSVGTQDINSSLQSLRCQNPTAVTSAVPQDMDSSLQLLRCHKAIAVGPGVPQEIDCNSQSLHCQKTRAVTCDGSVCVQEGHHQDISVCMDSSPSSQPVTSTVGSLLGVETSTGVMHQHCWGKTKPNTVSWTISSFDDIKQMLSATTRIIPNIQNYQLRQSAWSSSRCGLLGSRVLKSHEGESQESAGQISDDESDTETDNVGIDANLSGSDIETLPSSSTGSHKQEPDVSLPTETQDRQQSSQVDISSGTSSPTSSNPREKIRASDWIKVLQKEKTPEKEEHAMNYQGDSAKKKRKYARGSMAEQLVRLINREKASLRFWHHSVKLGTVSDTSGRHLQLQLQSLVKQYSLFISLCHLFDEGGISKPCRALFQSETVSALSLKPGVLVQVFPPWHQLEEESSGLKTFMCRHVRISSDMNNQQQPPSHIIENLRHMTTSSARWKCPCSSDFQLPPHACPAALAPVIPCLTLQLKTSHDTGGCGLHSATIHTVAAVSDHPGVCCALKQTLLESLERVRGDSSILPPFTATVLKVFRHRGKETWKHSFQLLVEDAAGTLAIVRLCEESPDMQETVYKAEGQMYTFSHVQVVSRTNRDRDHALFGIIEQVWNCQSVNTASQHSGSETSQTQVHTAVPGYAYVLDSVPGAACMFVDNTALCRQTSMRLTTLQEALQTGSGSRVSLVGRVLLPVRFNQACRPVTVFVCDASVHLDSEYTAVQRVEVGRECIMDTSSTDVYLFRDVYLQNGQFVCDGYSLVLDMAAWSRWGLSGKIDSSAVTNMGPVRLPLVDSLSETGRLVSIEGVISGIDESQAYSWEECQTCGSDRLTTVEESGSVYCTECNSRVTCPVTKMKMEVCVMSTAQLCPDLQVQLDLTQATIESLLPRNHSDGDDDEGFDTEQVIGQPIRCPACLVTSRVTDSSLSDGCPHPKIHLTLMELTH